MNGLYKSVNHISNYNEESSLKGGGSMKLNSIEFARARANLQENTEREPFSNRNWDKAVEVDSMSLIELYLRLCAGVNYRPDLNTEFLTVIGFVLKDNGDKAELDMNIHFSLTDEFQYVGSSSVTQGDAAALRFLWSDDSTVKRVMEENNIDDLELSCVINILFKLTHGWSINKDLKNMIEQRVDINRYVIDYTVGNFVFVKDQVGGTARATALLPIKNKLVLAS